jgi:hypothetical protein
MDLYYQYFRGVLGAQAESDDNTVCVPYTVVVGRLCHLRATRIVTISKETIATRSRVMVRHDVESMSLTIDDAAQLALDEEPIPKTALARFLYHRLQADEDQYIA